MHTFPSMELWLIQLSLFECRSEQQNGEINFNELLKFTILVEIKFNILLL